MNYSLSDLPDSGQNPIVYMDISLKGEKLGRILIKLFRDVFPAGVENFVGIAAGNTWQVIHKGIGSYKYTKQTARSYTDCKFFRLSHNNYIVSGDIYNNNGTSAGTIYNDEPIPACFGDYYFPHESKGLISLIPFKDETTGNIYYDSTFMITLDDAKPSNVLPDLDSDQIVIGHVYSGIDVIDKINQLIKPYAGRKYPDFIISNSGIHSKQNGIQRRHPVKKRCARKFTNAPQYVEKTDESC